MLLKNYFAICGKPEVIMIILGIGGSVHDYSCAVLVDGNIEVSIEEERISREKHGSGKRSRLFKCIDYCLDTLQISLEDVDCIVATDSLEVISLHKYLDKIIFVNHHIAHCASSYYTSGMDEAAGLVIDGWGSSYMDGKSEAISLYHADRSNGISLLHKIFCNLNFLEKNDIFKGAKANSIGNFYSIITHLCGFSILQDGKTMGLASYGKSTFENEISKFIQLELKKGKPYLAFDSEALVDYGLNLLKEKTINDNFDIFADVAYAGQAILEKIIFEIMNYLYSITNTKKLIYGGGVALNSVLNGKIKKQTPFEDVFIYPAAGDAGIGVGAALYMYHNILKYPYKNNSKLKTVFLGKVYNDEDILSCIKQFTDKISFKKCSETDLFLVAAQKIKENNIIGWYQGQTEVGPRALGNRSILANPSNAAMKDILNYRVKFREHFRPFAPSVLKEYMSDYFCDDFTDNSYMLFVSDVHEDKKYQIPGVVHVDGTALLQTVSYEDNRRYYLLIKNFYELTGIPMVINTSFNIKGKPIVETPKDAMLTFLNCDMDDLFLYDYHITKI